MSSATTSTAARTGLQIRDPRDAIAGALFIAFGLGGGAIALSYPLGSAMRMGVGYFPLLVSVALTLLGAVIVLRSLSWRLVERDALESLFVLRPALFIAAGVLAFALLVPVLGLLLATLAMTLLSGYARPQVRLGEQVALGLVLASFGVLVFAWGLGLQLPVLPV
ncbi:tripartite tricarboxylate transporter TctB family protein [Pseudomonas sp. 905_Psudmo1]|nr:tripartite tricarboxylate transporter TctB family protein [Pseudomonas sp. 905_Psudmo1]WFS21153.1 tripartite tricarboxylate transporter TctB family protein [Pseudomonas sp. 905_Psudmo1]